MILMTGGDKIPADAISEESADWLEQVWMDTQDEMDAAEWRDMMKASGLPIVRGEKNRV